MNYDERAGYLRRIARLRDAVEHITGHGFVRTFVPHHKRGNPRPAELPVPSAIAWIAEVLTGDDALAVPDTGARRRRD